MACDLRTSEGMPSEERTAVVRRPASVEGRVLAHRYRLFERIDEGGAGEVWRGRDEKLDRDVAIKLLGADADDAFRARFADEARRAAESDDQERLGTARYIAPERIEGGEVTARTDVYGLGLLAYELLAGRPAFEGVSTEELMRLRLESPPPSLRLVRVGIDDAIDGVVTRALSRDPGRRQASAGEFARALAGATERGDETAPLGMVALPRTIRRRSVPRLDSTVALLAMVAALVAP